MKRAVTILLIISQLLIFSSCDQNTTAFTESNHPRSESYNATFDTMCKTEGSLTVHIAEEVYEEKNADKVFQQIKEDYDKVIKVTGQKENPVTVYIVSKTTVGKVYCAENEIYCTPSDLEKEDFRMYLAKEALNLKDMWQCIGLSHYVFNEEKKEMNQDELKKYYSNIDNINTLSLFPAYFIEEFNDDTTLEVAKETACQLTKYIIEKDGMEKYISSANEKKYRKLWLESLGVIEKIPWETEQIKYLSSINFEMSEQYPLILSKNHWNYYFNTTEWLENANSMFQFWMKANAGYDYLLECFDESKLLNTEIVQNKMKEEKQIYIKDFDETYNDMLYGCTKGNDISLAEENAVWHEMVHVFIPPTTMETKRWIGEGIAENFGLKVQNKYGQEFRKDKGFNFLTYDVKETDKGDAFEFQKMAIEYYKRYSDLPTDEDDINEELLEKALGVTALLHPELDSNIYMLKTSIAETSLRKKQLKNIGGNALSYPEAYVFVEYLANTYGMDTVASSVCEVGDLEKYYGKNYEELYNDLISYLQE